MTTSDETLVIDNIGLLVTNDAELGNGPLGKTYDAAVVVADGRVVAIEKAGVSADRQIDAAGRCVIPGFVDSHTHMVFAGDRSEEFAARMAGEPYTGGGIAVTTSATNEASDEELRIATAGRVAEARAAGITHLEIKSGYGLTVDGETRLLRIANEFTEDTTFLGAHVVPPGTSADRYVDLVTGEMLDSAKPHARFVDVFCEEGAFDADQSMRVLEAGLAAGLIPKIHANQLGPGSGVQIAVAVDAASADHCTYLVDADIDALAGSNTVATFLPASDFSTRQPYPDARRLLDAGATAAIATNCNPGSSYTTSMSFCIALAVRDMHMTVDEALWAATAGGAAALRRMDIGRLAPGMCADIVVLDAPAHSHLAYRPGVPLVAATLQRGVVVAERKTDRASS